MQDTAQFMNYSTLEDELETASARFSNDNFVVNSVTPNSQSNCTTMYDEHV